MKYIFYPTVHFIKGYLRALIYESDRLMTYLVPNDFEKLFNISEKEGLELEKIEPITLDFILQNDLVFEISNDLLLSFPKSELINFSHLRISNLVVDYSSQNLNLLLNKSTYFKETSLYFKLNNNIDYKSMSSLIEKNQCDNVEFGIFNKKLLDTNFIEFINSINKLIIINCFFDINILEKGINLNNFDNSKIILLERNFDNLILTTGVRHFYEAHENHTFFNKKLFLNPDGILTIFENESEPKVNLSNCTINEINEFIRSNEVQLLWKVRKENTVVCKDCENRFFCIDKRIPKHGNFGVYHEVECQYNPFIAKWEGEIGYRTLSECGVISNENEFSIDHNRIAEINKEIWEEE